MDNFYEILGVSMYASKSEIKRAFRLKAVRLHPDRDVDYFQLLVEAYHVLSDSGLRERYDSSSPQNRERERERREREERERKEREERERKERERKERERKERERQQSKLTGNFYEILGVSMHASESEIKRAYHFKAMQVHPDRGGTDADFQVLSEAYSVLSNPVLRERYDSNLQWKEQEHREREQRRREQQQREQQQREQWQREQQQRERWQQQSRPHARRSSKKEPKKSKAYVFYTFAVYAAIGTAIFMWAENPVHYVGFFVYLALVLYSLLPSGSEK
jgi:curved DNA-binding protein CbpA